MSATHIQVPTKPAVGGTWYSSQVAEEFKTVRTGAGMLNSIHVTNVSGSTRYVYVFDNTASSGAIILAVIPLTSGSRYQFYFMWGMPFKTGLRIAASSTLATFTPTAAPDLMMTVGYAINTP